MVGLGLGPTPTDSPNEPKLTIWFNPIFSDEPTLALRSYLICHAPTHSQARDNRRVNPSRVINTFLELAQGFQTPVHTYNSPITGEYNKFKKNTKGCVYIYISEIQALTKIQPKRIHSTQKKV